ncbi:DMT family transporter [Actinoplanes sp. TBRC 11911]|uniref:DMT family transporter n=1 Tax=Actinoplanes sp. TBRC 11911 TaxID=2729386 RepID=UPI00145E05EE|nr:DMT family transporter [Actinoplanes sp. TBRC 11911]NMO50548.1 DMT family transporter [Actinoplanes sp. TBRC 11911]
MDNHSGRSPVPVDAYLSLLGTMAFFGSAFASSKVVVEQVPHQVAAVLRFGGGALILLVIAAAMSRRRPDAPRLSWRQVVRCGLVGLLGVFAYNMFFFWGLTKAPSIDGSIIVPVLSPVLTTGALMVTRAERTTRSRAVGLVLGLLGALVFFLGIDEVGGLGSSRIAGELLFLLGAVAWAAYSIASKRVLVGMDPLRATTVATTIGALFLLIFAVPAVSDTDWGALSGTVLANVIYLAIGPTAVAYLLFYRGLSKVSPSTATVMMFAVPVFGIACSVLFLGESFTAWQIIGSLIMLMGALLAVNPRAVAGRSARVPSTRELESAGDVR